MSNLPGWTDAEDAVLRRMSADGHSFGDAAKALGRTRNMVAGRAGRLRIRFNGPSRYRPSHGPEAHARLAELWNDGRTYRQIAAELGLPVGTVSAWRFFDGLPPRYPASA